MCLPSHVNDFDLIEEVFVRLADKKKKIGLSSLAPHERAVYFIWAALGILENGSFQYFYENGLSGNNVAESLDVLELGQLAKYFRDAEQIMSRGGLLRNWDEKLQYLQTHEAAFDSIAGEILRTQKEIEVKLAAYIRTRQTLF